MARAGHFMAQILHPVQRSGFMTGKLSFIVMAWEGHSFAQSPHPIHPTAQMFFTPAPFLVELHSTRIA
jgi:hypothetical protein